MALLKVAKLGHPVLRRPAQPLGKDELAGAAVQALIDDMIQTMRDADGVGLAAPQVHMSLRIIAIEVGGQNPRYAVQDGVPLTVIVNPEIVAHADQREEDWEGCLSIPDLRGRVPRWRSVSVRGLDRDGRPLSIEAENFFARVIQHEVDHLDGIVFLDRMTTFATLTHLREFQRFWLGAPAASGAARS